MKKILHPTDFSECADFAAELATYLAAALQAELIFLHIYDDPVGELHTPGTALHYDTGKGKATAALHERVNRAEKLGVKAKPLLVINKGSDVIENYISPLHIDMVVMGTHGLTGIRRKILGSHAERVVKKAHVPVMVVKNKPQPIKNMLFATTRHENVEPAFTFVATIASACSSSVHLVQIEDSSPAEKTAGAEENLRKLTASYPQVTFTYNSIATNDPAWGIQQISSRLSPDLIALTTALKESSFIFTHSLAEDLIRTETRPVLVLKT
jgi:nucleotide-binding universal stress UspA family protein